MPPPVWKADLPPEQSGLKVLGAPLGTDEYVHAARLEAAATEQRLLDALLRLPTLQGSWLILLYCAAPRANYLLRTVPPPQARAYAEDHDARVLTAMRSLLVRTTEADAEDGHGQWVRQATLPCRLGGMGLRSARRTAPAAYWASWADSLEPLRQRYPGVAAGALTLLQGPPRDAPPCIRAAQEAVLTLDAAGYAEGPAAREDPVAAARPSWLDLYEGRRAEGAGHRLHRPRRLAARLAALCIECA